MTTMRNIERRLEKLERLGQKMRATSQSIRERALSWFWPQQLEILISGSYAERESRLLTESEAAAQKAYADALEQECKSAGFRPPADFDRRPDISEALLTVIACHGDYDRFVGAIRAYHEGRTLTEEEVAALQDCSAEMQRLSQMAGFDVNTEINRYCGVEFSLEGRQ